MRKKQRGVNRGAVTGTITIIVGVTITIITAAAEAVRCAAECGPNRARTTPFVQSESDLVE